MLGRAPFLSCAVVLLLTGGAPRASAAAQKPGAARDAERIHQMEGQAVLELADAALSGQPVPSDFAIQWQNDFLKAQQGTFVPFVVTIDGRSLVMPAALLYVRLAARSRTRGDDGLADFATEGVYPIDMRAAAGRPVRVTRGLSARAGDYDLVVVVRERADPANPGLRRRAGVLSRRLSLPDFPPGELSTSSVILADRLATLEAPPRDTRPEERPYLIGLSDIEPATDHVLRRSEELIVVFLVYNPFVTPERKFDVQVEYHFFTRNGGPGRPGGPGENEPPDAKGTRPTARDGERYFNHTKPQRFTPAIMGPQFDPSAGDPLMAGQGVPLAPFPEGEYRLAIKVTDVVTGKSILRDVEFRVAK
jgi:hypothetical protein